MNKLQKIVGKSSKRLGRGMGSGKGAHTVGRGQKGQKSRTNIGVLFEGIKVKKSLIKRLPLRRGKEKFHGNAKPITVKLSLLNLLSEGSVVSMESLIKAKIVNGSDAKTYGIKILGDGEISKKYIVKLPVSKHASAAIIKAGGSVENAK